LFTHRVVLSPIGAVVLSVVAGALAAAPTSAAASSNRLLLASELTISRQYHGLKSVVSGEAVQAVSRPIPVNIVGSLRANRHGYFQLDHRSELSLGLTVEIAAGQYQQAADEPERRLMLLVGLALAAAYVVFVIGWIWATRLRSRPPRH